MGFVAQGCQQFHQLAQGKYGGVEGQGDFFLEEVDPRGADAFPEFKEVFEQPDARTAMHRRDVERDPGRFVVGVVEQVPADGGVVEVGVFVAVVAALEGDAGVLGEVVVGTQAVGRQDFVHGFAPLAAEMLVVPGADAVVGAGVAAVVAKDFLGNWRGLHASGWF